MYTSQRLAPNQTHITLQVYKILLNKWLETSNTMQLCYNEYSISVLHTVECLWVLFLEQKWQELIPNPKSPKKREFKKTHYRLIPNPKGSSNKSPKKTIWGPKPESETQGSGKGNTGKCVWVLNNFRLASSLTAHWLKTWCIDQDMSKEIRSNHKRLRKFDISNSNTFLCFCFLEEPSRRDFVMGG